MYLNGICTNNTICTNRASLVSHTWGNFAINLRSCLYNYFQKLLWQCNFSQKRVSNLLRSKDTTFGLSLLCRS